MNGAVSLLLSDFVPIMYTGQDDTLHDDDFSDGYIWVDDLPCSKAVTVYTAYVWLYIKKYIPQNV